MAYVIADRVKETTTTTGTGAASLDGAVTGFQAFSAVCSNNDVVWYCIAHQAATEWEVGLGTWNTGPVLTRTDAGVLAGSSGAGARVSFSSGTKDVFITAPASRIYALTNELVLNTPIVTAIPAAPSTGYLKIYSRNRAGRYFVDMKGPSGMDTSLQPALFGNNVTMWLPGTGTTAAIAFGVNWTTGATQAHPAIADTSVMTSIKRATYTTTTTAGNASGVRTGAAVAIRNRGFFFFARFGISTYHSAMQVVVGLNGSNAILAGEPSAVNDTIAMTKDTGETTWQVTTRDTSTAHKNSTGRTTAIGSNVEIFDFTAFCKPGDTKITERVVDAGDGTVLIDNVEETSNLPTAATILYAHAECRNVTGGAGVTAGIFVNRIYIETDM